MRTNRMMITVKIKIKFFLFVLLSLPKTICFNFSAFPFFTAIKLPVLVGYNYKIQKVKKNIISFHNTRIYAFIIKFGHNGSSGPNSRKGVLMISSGNLIFHGPASFAKGCSIRCNGNLSIGENFTSNKNATIICLNNIIIQNNVMFGWNVSLLDNDGHKMIVNGKLCTAKNGIEIGTHTWVCSEVHILNGARIGKNCVVGYRSLVNKAYNFDNILLAGSPAMVKKHNINWDF